MSMIIAIVGLPLSGKSVIANMLVTEYGAHQTTTEAVQDDAKRATLSTHKILLLEELDTADLLLQLSALKNVHVLYVVAPAGVRYERLLARAELTGESVPGRTAFLAGEIDTAEMGIGASELFANAIFQNEATLVELELDVTEYMISAIESWR